MTADFESASLGSIPSKTYFLIWFIKWSNSFIVSVELVINKNGKKEWIRALIEAIKKLIDITIET